MDEHIKVAEDIYRVSENSLMAHTIRAIKQRFIEKKLKLDFQIEPDIDNVLKDNAISGLISFLKGDIVCARIYIRKDASRPLARFCIAHEIYHLLLQLNAFDPQYKFWPNGDLERHDEDACDAFAWHLCKKHNDFYWDQEKLAQCRFSSKEGFPGIFRTREFSTVQDWPTPFRIDSKKPFFQPL